MTVVGTVSPTVIALDLETSSDARLELRTGNQSRVSSQTGSWVPLPENQHGRWKLS